MTDVNLVKILPVAKGVFKEELTYFSSLNPEPGDLVLAPLRTKNIVGLVRSVEKVSDLKTEIKNSEFGFKKIEKIVSKNFLSKEFVEAVNQTSNYFATNPGQIINLLTPINIIQAISNKTKKITPATWPTNSEDKFEINLIQTFDEERLSFYKSIIRESFAKKRSVFICIPTSSSVDIVLETLGKGIEEHTVVLNGELPAKEIFVRFKRCSEETHPLLIIATPMFLSLQRGDISTVIVDQENSSSFKSMRRPLIDFRFFIEKLCQKRKNRLIFGDNLLRVETLKKKEDYGLSTVIPIKRKFTINAKSSLIDMKKHKPILEERLNDGYTIISPELENVIKNGIKTRKNSFLFVLRKGFASQTVCCDCGEILKCQKCLIPIVYYKEKVPFFACNRCKNKISAETSCSNCTGWRLKTLGVGTERVKEELEKIVDKEKIFSIEHGLEEKPRDTIKRFLSSPGSVLVGTKLGLDYLKEPIANTSIVSVDGLFSIPDFKINEIIFGIVTKLRGLSMENFILQTRKIDEKIFDFAEKGDFMSFYKEEISEREKFGYPPFSVLIKITREGEEKLVNKEISELENYLKKYNPIKYKPFVSAQTGRYKLNLLIKMKEKNWPEEFKENADESNLNLMEVLKTLPPRFIVDIEPNSII